MQVIQNDGKHISDGNTKLGVSCSPEIEALDLHIFNNDLYRFFWRNNLISELKCLWKLICEYLQMWRFAEWSHFKCIHWYKSLFSFMLLFTIGSLPTSNKRLATELDQTAPT